jgi:hypothetical protein
MMSEPLDEPGILQLADVPAPASYVNWTLCLAGAPRTTIVEAALYTDTWIVGECEVGPFKFINTIAHVHGAIALRPAIVLRFACYWPSHGYKPALGTSDEHYHGGDHFDEVAALTSLILGIRAQAGPITRDFSLRGDPLGTPVMFGGMKSIPTLFPSHQNPILPRLRGQVNLTALAELKRFCTFSPSAASVVIKSARAYQSALWFADSHPEMSWLLLVSAIETAAGYWAKNHFRDDESFLPNVVDEILREHSCPETVDEPLSNYLRETTKSARKFVAFLKAFLPEPPADRPESENLRIDFSSDKLIRDFKIIYSYRSRALHTGVPFPLPMCFPRHPDLKEERQFALGMSSRGATWSFNKHRPMLFHTFEHIARGALLRWMDSL